MPIEAERTTPRSTIAWSGSVLPPEASDAFESHMFNIAALGSNGTQGGLPLVTTEVAALFTDTGKAGKFAQELKALAPHLLSHGCGVLALTRAVPHVTNAMNGAGLPCVSGTVQSAADKLLHPYIYVVDQAALDGNPRATKRAFWNRLANRALDWAKEPIPRAGTALTIALVRNERRICSEDDILIHRAFWDASELYLEEIAEGKSGAIVCSAHARLDDGWAAPLFLKLGDRDEIIREYWAYQDRVDQYVPFHLGPGLAHRRCCLGSTRGILVGDFVEESESLLDCARGGRASAAISSLFHGGLRGLHGRTPTVSPQSLGAFLSSNSWSLPALGAVLQQRAEQIGGQSFTGAPPNPRIANAYVGAGYKKGWIHADLNAKNIRVRTGDAVLIDFAKSEPGPLLLDAAALEASLLVSGGPSSKKEAAEWRNSVKTLYTKPLEMAPPRADPADAWSWFHDCVRQIRMHARELELATGQYAIALGWSLAQKACKDEVFRGVEADTRAYSYVLADRVLL